MSNQSPSNQIYVEEIPGLFENIGCYAAALPRWTPKHVGPQGQKIEIWYNHETRDWVTSEYDKNDNEIQNIYCGNKDNAIMNAKIWQNDWYKPEPVPTPPTDIMGVENSTILKSWHVDYLTITVWGQDLAKSFDQFFVPRGIFRPLKDLQHGGRFYQDTYSGDLGIMIRERPVEGTAPHCTIELPGQACQLLGYQGICDFLQILHFNHSKVRINRLDTAFNNCKFTVQDVINAVQDENLRSYFKRETIKTYSNPYERKENEKDLPKGSGTSGISIGGRSSTRYMRVYDKHGYTRMEIEYKGRKADQVAHDLFDCRDEKTALKLAMGHVMDYIEFFSEWWIEFMDNFERLYSKLPQDVQELSIEKIQTWFEKQIAAAFYVMGDLVGHEYFDYLKYVGECKYKQSRYFGLIEMNKIKQAVM